MFRYSDLALALQRRGCQPIYFGGPALRQDQEGRMIHYQLRCAGGHDFDGWFRDSVAFDAQARAGFVECPTCGGTEVGKRLMAPAIPKKGARRRPEGAPQVGGGPQPPSQPPAPAMPTEAGQASGSPPGGGMVAG